MDVRPYVKRMAQPFLWAAYRAYLSKARWYQYKGLKIRVLPSVFYPGWLGSTTAMSKYLLQLDLTNKHVFELGAGSGLISLCAAKMGAYVTASDINPLAIKSIRKSLKKNGLSIQVIESDLFEKISDQYFDYIVINPPYYPKNPKDFRELAFYCGEDFDFFKRLFNGLISYLLSGAIVLMVLSESCEIEMIRFHAKQAGIQMSEMERTRKLWEWHYIFRLTLVMKF